MRSEMKAVLGTTIMLAIALGAICMVPISDADTGTSITAEDFKGLAVDGTITLDGDYILSDALVVTDTLTIDLNGHSITNAVTNESHTIEVTSTGNVTIVDDTGTGSIVNVTTTKAGINNLGTLVFENGTIVSSGPTIMNEGTASIHAGTFSDMDVINHLASGANVHIDVPTDMTRQPVFLQPNLGADITVDLNAHVYTFSGEAVGSNGTESQAMHLEMGSTILIQDGTIRCENPDTTTYRIKMLVNNYVDLTLDDVTLDGRNLDGTGRYVLSNNFGSATLTGDSDITAKDGDVAIDVWYGMSSKYDAGVRLVFDDAYTGTVTGAVEYGVKDRDDLTATDYSDLVGIEINGGTFDVTSITATGKAVGNEGMVGNMVSGGTFNQGGAVFALTNVVSQSTIGLKGVITLDADMELAEEVTVALTSGSTLDGRLVMGSVMVQLDDVRTGTGLVMADGALMGDVASGQLTVDGSFAADLTMADGVKLTIPAGSSMVVADGSSVTGGSVVNYGAVHVDGTLGSSVSNHGTVTASMAAVLPDGLTGNVDQVRPTIQPIADVRIDMGGSVSVVYEASDGVSVRLSGAAWASVSDGRIVGTPTGTGTWIIVATPYVGDNEGQSTHFIVQVDAVSDSTPDTPATDDKNDDKRSIDWKLVVYIVFGAIIVVTILRLIL